MLSKSVYSSLICPKLRRSGRGVTSTECARIYGDVVRAHFFCAILFLTTTQIGRLFSAPHWIVEMISPIKLSLLIGLAILFLKCGAGRH